MRQVLLSVGLIGCLFVGGCGEQIAPTASGRPEVTINGVAADKIKPVLVSLMLDKRYKLEKDSPYELVFGKVTDNLAVAVLMSTKLGGLPELRVDYTIAEIGPATRIVANAGLVSNPGTAFENTVDVSEGPTGIQVQSFLNDVAAKVGKPEAAKGKLIASR